MPSNGLFSKPDGFCGGMGRMPRSQFIDMLKARTEQNIDQG